MCVCFFPVLGFRITPPPLYRNCFYRPGAKLIRGKYSLKINFFPVGCNIYIYIYILKSMRVEFEPPLFIFGSIGVLVLIHLFILFIHFIHNFSRGADVSIEATPFLYQYISILSILSCSKSIFCPRERFR